MFCKQCGAEAGGNFCSTCGAALGQPSGGDWSNEVLYANIIQNPAVQDLIKQHAANSKKRLSGEEFLGLAESILPVNVPMKTIAKRVIPFYAKMGLKTGKNLSKNLPDVPVGTALIAALCSFAKHGQSLRGVRQLENGCQLEASIPSDMFAVEGFLNVTVVREGNGVYVEASTLIEGQIYDWGKSKRCLESLVNDIASILA